MNNIKVSYLIALYNKEKYVVECIDSILAEESDTVAIEICVVDDGSTDASLSIVKGKYLNNKSVKIAYFESNRGKNAAYNEAYLMSTGSHICIFGADDVVVPYRTTRLLEYSIKNKCSVYGRLLAFKDDIKPSVDKKPISKRKLSFYENIIHNTLSGGVGLIIREHANKIFPIPENLSFEDWWISYHLLKSNFVKEVDEYVTYYRVHEDNDYASLEDSYSAIKRDYLRHFDYLEEFECLANSRKEIYFISKSRLLRQAFLGKSNMKSIYIFCLEELLSLSFDINSLKVIFFHLISSKKIYDCKDFILRDL